MMPEKLENNIENSEQNDQDEVVKVFKGGGSFVNHKPQFSNDGESVFISWKELILQYSTKTGKLINEFKGLSNNIVGFSCHSYNTFDSVTACSDKGQVITWKTSTRFKIYEKQLPLKKVITFAVLVDKDLKAILSYEHHDGTIRFCTVDLMKKLTKDFKLRLNTSEKYYYDVSANILSVVQNNKVYFQSLNRNAYSRPCIRDNRYFTCVACHPSEEIVLTGDDLGRVIIWQNLFEQEKAQNVFHWHTLPVKTVAFSTVGSYFYSGADECVLVKWQFDNADARQYVPRLPDGIRHISVSNNNTLIAVSTSDNAIRIFDAQLNQVSLIQHLVLGSQHSCGINYDPKTKALVMNGNLGCVQFYSPSDMSLIYNVEIVTQNKITDERDCSMENTEVTKIALSSNGIWLAAVEERKDSKFSTEIRLKFFKFNSEKQKFELNTSIEYPHEKSINSIAFQPARSDDNIRCVTVGNDKMFKIWELLEANTIYRKGMAWKCTKNGFYRDLNCTSLSFSMDGSLFATAFQEILTTWTPDSCDLKCSLVHPTYRGTIRHVQFGYGNQQHLLVAADNNKLCVWSMLTLAMVWIVPMKGITLLLADRLSTTMAVFTGKNKLYVFSPASPNILYSSDKLLDEDNVVAANFVPSKAGNASIKWCEHSQLYFITSKNVLYCLGKPAQEFEDYEIIETEEEKSLYGRILPEMRNSMVKSINPKNHLFEKDVKQESFRKFLEAPIYTSPPIGIMCFSILKSMVFEQEPEKMDIDYV